MDDRFVVASAAAGSPQPRDVVRFAWQELQSASNEDDLSLRLAFAVLVLQPASSVGRTLRHAVGIVFRSQGQMLLPYVDRHDLEVRVLERSLRLRSVTLASAVEKGSLAALLRHVARWVALDELRAMERRPRVAFDTDAVAAQLTYDASSVDDTLDARALLASLVDEVPAWAADVLVPLLLGDIDRVDALRELNDRRAAQGQPAWSMDTMRVWLHRVRVRLRAAAAASTDEP